MGRDARVLSQKTRSSQLTLTRVSACALLGLEGEDMQDQMRRLRWVESLKEQHPEHADLIDDAAKEVQGFYGADFGDHILGRLEEAGVSV